MGKKLASTVYVTDDKGRVTRHTKGTSWSSKLGKAITNDSAWVDDSTGVDEADDTSTAEEPPTTGPGEPDTGDSEEPTVTTATGTDQGPVPPPRSGKGSGRDEWAEFAAASEVNVPDGASRDDIIAFLEERGIIDPEDA